MAVIGVTTAHSSSGASSLAMGIAQAWSFMYIDHVLVEGDPFGGVLSSRFNLDGNHRTLQDLAPSLSEVDPAVLGHYVTSIEGVDCVVGPVGHEDAYFAVEQAAPSLCHCLRLMGRSGVVDLGRMHRHSPWFEQLASFDSILFVARALPEEIAATAAMVKSVDGQVSDLRVAVLAPQNVIGRFKSRRERFLPKDQAASSIRSAGNVEVEAILYDPEGAEIFCGAKADEAKFRNTDLWGSIADLASVWSVNDPSLQPENPPSTPEPEPPRPVDEISNRPVVNARPVADATRGPRDDHDKNSRSTSSSGSWFEAPAGRPSAPLVSPRPTDTSRETQSSPPDDAPPPLNNPTRS